MAITKPVTRTLISTTAWGIPITDEVNALRTELDPLKPAPWISATLQNGWTNIGGGWPPAQYRKVGDMVQIRAMVAGGTIGTAMFTLPAGYRSPYITQQVTVTGTGIIGVTTINTDGTVVASVGNNGSFMLNSAFALV